MTFAWIGGFMYALRARRSDLAPLLVFTVIVTLAYSTVHGNVDVACRQRSQIMIFLFLLAAIGTEVKRARARGLAVSSIEAAPAGRPQAPIAALPERPA